MLIYSSKLRFFVSIFLVSISLSNLIRASLIKKLQGALIYQWAKRLPLDVVIHAGPQRLSIILFATLLSTRIIEPLWLEQRGFHNLLNWVKMVRGNETPAEVKSEFTLKPVLPDERELAAKVACKGFGMPPFLLPLMHAAFTAPNNYAYMMWDDKTPVAVGILSVVGDVGHLNTAATIPEYRRRGAQGALMSHRIKEAITKGCKLICTETGVIPNQPNSSYQNMLRCGFSLAYERPNYVLQS